MHAAAWVALLPPDSPWLPACARLLAELLHVCGGARLSLWLRGTLVLVAARCSGGTLPRDCAAALRRCLPRSVLSAARPASPIDDGGGGSVLSAASSINDGGEADGGGGSAAGIVLAAPTECSGREAAERRLEREAAKLDGTSRGVRLARELAQEASEARRWGRRSDGGAVRVPG